MEITVLYQTGPFLCTPDGDSPNKTLSANLPQMEIPLLHQTGPLWIYPWWRLPYYTIPANLLQMEITLLHQPCYFTQMGITVLCLPQLMYPKIEITLLYHLLLIYPRWTLLYYTRQALLIYPRWRLLYYTTPVNLPQRVITLLHQPC